MQELLTTKPPQTAKSRVVAWLRPPVLGLLSVGLLGTGLLASCGSSLTSGTTTAATDPLTFSNDALPVAYTGENFQASVSLLGGVAPYTYRVVSGKLPPGLSLSGGSLSGKPTATGVYKFTLEASDANLSNKVQDYTLNVNELPPLSLEVQLPTGEIRGATRIPLTIKAARTVRAARLIWDVSQDAKVTQIQAADPGTVLFWKQEGQILTLDMGFRTVPRSASRVALLTITPTRPLTLNTSNLWYDSRDSKGTVLGERKRPEPAVAPATPAVTSGPATTSSDAATTSTATPSTATTSTATTSTATTQTVTAPASATALPTPALVPNTAPIVTPTPGSVK